MRGLSQEPWHEVPQRSTFSSVVWVNVNADLSALLCLLQEIIVGKWEVQLVVCCVSL